MINIKELQNAEELDAALKTSMEKPVILFKHSNTCSISANAKQQVDRFAMQEASDIEIYMVVVQTSRPVSNEIAERLGVKHESPQILLVKDGRSYWDCSHNMITQENITQALQSN